ncbi:UDP-glucose 4-epimerase GalE [Cryptosporangium aurantiacum]|uniref:UDP-glucose 4-epimerase n=1 Tax=Cryptosporangium aurantiacum TaxID=134849 RepID=A0A1M7RL43_9ACTN|nr:UDP-glucose 4-epimerase GalE [Cryptosporangium aurantiacum]SHN46882.1 UDP-galactose 4-epimerase [Cryptosporangium aurantiacum]
MKVLITGGAGFIGSTIGSACLDGGIQPVILDSLVTGRREFTEGRAFYHGDIADGALVDRIFAEHPEIAAVIHCAALIVVPDSMADPLRYYRENVAKSIELIGHLQRNGCERLIFSSSASMYGADPDFSVDENSAIDPQSPYATTKVMVENVLRDVAQASSLRVLSLRYFNPIGADPQLRTGLQVARPSHALGKLVQAYEDHVTFSITGIDWPTRDGTGIRDYVHVWDLAGAHVEGLRRFDDVVPADDGYRVICLGSGTGTTVRELVAAFEAVIGGPLPHRDAPARPGDVVGAYARNGLARDLLGWEPKYGVEEGIRHSLEWAAIRPQRLRDA